MPRGDGYGGRPAQRWVAAVLERDGDTCHLCGHAGAESADHLKPRETHPHLMYDVANGKPVHHQPCPVCGVRCNIRRKSKPLTAVGPVSALEFFDSGPRPEQEIGRAHV